MNEPKPEGFFSQASKAPMPGGVIFCTIGVAILEVVNAIHTVSLPFEKAKFADDFWEEVLHGLLFWTEHVPWGLLNVVALILGLAPLMVIDQAPKSIRFLWITLSLPVFCGAYLAGRLSLGVLGGIALAPIAAIILISFVIIDKVAEAFKGEDK